MNTLPQWRCRIMGVMLSRFLKNETGYCVSVVIVTHDSASFLNLTLASLEVQWFPKKAYEIIVVDCGSLGETAEVVQEYRERGKLQIKLIAEEMTGDTQPLETGLHAARGTVVLFLEDRRIVPRDFLVLHLRHHTNENSVVVGGSHRSIHTHLFASNYLDMTGTLPQCALGFSEILEMNRLSDFIIDNEPYFENAFGELQSEASFNMIPWYRFNLLNTSLPRKLLVAFPIDATYQNTQVAALDLGKRLEQSGTRIMRDKQAFALRQISQAPMEDRRDLRKSLELFLLRQCQEGERPSSLLIGDQIIRFVK